MSERYFITGVQIGIMRCALNGTLPMSKAVEIIKTIEDDQFIGNIINEKDRIEIVDFRYRTLGINNFSELFMFLETFNRTKTLDSLLVYLRMIVDIEKKAGIFYDGKNIY